jgi:hypothetical protein
MTYGEFADALVARVKKYASNDVLGSVKRNGHMNQYMGEQVSQATIDAILVDFVNFACMPIDLALYTQDLHTAE